MLRTSFICIIDQHADVYQNLFKQKHKECKGLFLRTGAHKRLSGCEHNTNELIEKAMVQVECVTLPFYFCGSNRNTAIVN